MPGQCSSDGGSGGDMMPRASSFAAGEREAIKKSVSRSCLLDRESVEELSDSAGEEAAEAME